MTQPFSAKQLHDRAMGLLDCLPEVRRAAGDPELYLFEAAICEIEAAVRAQPLSRLVLIHSAIEILIRAEKEGAK